MNSVTENILNGYEIAVIGMSCRFPSAKNIDEFWLLLKKGKEGIIDFTEDELKRNGVPDVLLNDPKYVRRNGHLSGKNMFDALLFDYSAREAALLNPQTAIFHECVWEALEHAGYHNDRFDKPIGLYAGAGGDSEWLSKVSEEDETPSEAYNIGTLASSQFLCTRIAYKFNFRGPAFGVQTACSTSLVAVYLACQGLNSGECDIALAGGVNIHSYRKCGYLFQEGMILSSDGHCRPFDAGASGTVGGEGAGVLVLKRVDDAISDRDNILAIIKGSAINNDGNQKVGYTAPSVKGQSEVVKSAFQLADISPQTVSYIEAHGTATQLGDPIEIKALTNAFEDSEKGSCKIGSVKSNIGHLDVAAGIAGMIKTILALKHRQLPPSLHFETPNPDINFENSPFLVNTELCEWDSKFNPLRAGVSSFGIGGTNAHIVLEESCFNFEVSESRRIQLVFLSGKSPTALQRIEQNIAKYILDNPSVSLPDICYTLHVGRKALPYRKAFLAADVNELKSKLGGTTIDENFSGYVPHEKYRVCFMFPGLESQYVKMGKDLYYKEKEFQKKMDNCFSIAYKLTSIDFKSLLFKESSSEKKELLLNEMEIMEPALFILEYSLAELLISWGCHPDIMIGQGVGEVVAACLSGVFSLEEGLSLIIQKSIILQNSPSNTVLNVISSEINVNALIDKKKLNRKLRVLAVNDSDNLKIFGSLRDIDEFQKLLNTQGIKNFLVHESPTFQSIYTEEVSERCNQIIGSISFFPPSIPFISSVSGDLITLEQAISEKYWTQDFCQCIQLDKCVRTILENKINLFVEVGPGDAMSTFVSRIKPNNDTVHCIVLLPGEANKNTLGEENRLLMSGLCKLFIAGVSINWNVFYQEELRRRIPLPTYPFERSCYWLQDNNCSSSTTKNSLREFVRQPIDKWYTLPVWRPVSPALFVGIEETDSWLIFMDNGEVGKKIIDHISNLGKRAISVNPGDTYQKVNCTKFIINPRMPEHYTKLVLDLETNDQLPANIIHLWGISILCDDFVAGNNSSYNDKLKLMGYYSQVYLSKALAALNKPKDMTVKVCSNATIYVMSNDKVIPEKSVNIATSKVAPAENPFLKFQYIDISLEEWNGYKPYEREYVIKELLNNHIGKDVIAYRRGICWVQEFRDVAFPAVNEKSGTFLRKNGCYLITGGLGGIGLTLAMHIARCSQSTLILITRSKFIPRTQWEEWLSTHNEDEEISRKIKKIMEIENNGSPCIIATLDIADTEKMKTTIPSLVEQVGHVNGIFHAAGLPGNRVIQLVDDEDVEAILSPKIKGTMNLHEFIPKDNLDFMILFSSLASLLGGLGQIAYCAANIFLDTFAQLQNVGTGTKCISINWPAWKETGMAFRRSLVKAYQTAHEEELEKLGILPSEGIEAFFRVFSHGSPSQIIVSPYSIQMMLKRYKEIGLSEIEKGRQPEVIHKRPEIPTKYVKPKTKIERCLSEIWSEILGLDAVGVEDNFFELGGNSLVMISIQRKIVSNLEINIPVAMLFRYPSIRTLSNFISEGENNEYSRDDAFLKGKRRLLNLRGKSKLKGSTEVKI